MTEWLLSSSVLILIVISLRAVLKSRISLRLQYAMWGLVLLRLLIPFSIGSTDFSVANFAPRTEQIGAFQTVEPQENMHVDHHAQQPQLQPEEMPPKDSIQNAPAATEEPFKLGSDVIYAVWGVGVAAVAALFLATNLRFRRKIMASRYGLSVRKNNLEIFVSDEIDTPCLFGILNPAIYVTQGVAEEETILRHTLEHEATHHGHGDHIWAILRCVCLAIHWYNPLVWWAAFLSQRDAELACDEGTIRRLGDVERVEYGRTLIDMTCQKRTNVFLTATTMTTGKRGIKERILLIAKKPKTAVYMLVVMILVAAVAVGCTFTGAKKEEDSGGTLPSVTEATQTTETQQATETTTLPTTTEPGQTIPVSPSAETTQPPATETSEVTEPVNPLGITEIKSATLDWNGAHTVTVPYALKTIEKWLINAKEIGSAACPFTAQLTLELEDGETKTFRMATDSCATFLLEGVTYSYAELAEDGYTDNAPFYSLFAPAVIQKEAKEGIDRVIPYLNYLNWMMYWTQYGPEETFALLHSLEGWVAEEPTYIRYGCIIECGKGLDAAMAEGYGYVLAGLYELAPAEFAWACLGNATDEAEERTIFYLAFEWEMTQEEARAKLEAQLSQNG